MDRVEDGRPAEDGRRGRPQARASAPAKPALLTYQEANSAT